ncbi:MAG: NUDIX domain-containing protein [Bacteroidales bacterium]|nr:NUDIX domain-containing protein [Bacteroidales bacterium]MDE7126937.1 NUDIX domain-containing protein [Bacteroidales bacterium]
MTTVETSSAISVDCAVFGFDGTKLKALLIKRKYTTDDLSADDLKLPGSMILENETLQGAASRVLEESTGLRDIFLKQTSIFSDPDRVSDKEMDWICRYHGIKTRRVVTVGYYALVKLTDGIINYTLKMGARWVDVDDICHLAMDHLDILSDALSVLRKEMIYSPVAFELLPKRFTMRQLQNLFIAVLGVEIDDRNFRKKIFSTGILKPTGEKEKNVSHKPAEYYTFNRSEFRKLENSRNKLGFIGNWSY